jgi:hypothetical protein
VRQLDLDRDHRLPAGADEDEIRPVQAPVIAAIGTP